MSIRWLWFPAAVAVAVVVGVALGLLTDTDSDSEVQSSASSTSTTVSTDPTSTTTASPTTTVTTDDTAGTTTTTEGNSVPVGFSTQWGWFHTGTSTGELPAMQPIPEQTALVVADFDGDGSDDIIVGGRRGENALQLMRLTPSGWSTAVIEPDELSIEAGGAAHDIDGDGDLDLAMGGDFSSQDVWWWENPGADNIEQRWTRRTIKTNGGPKHHDMVFADIDGDGPAELIFWNQRSETPTLWAATIPADPTSAGQWNRDSIFFGTDASEGLDAGDVDGDGDIDLLAGGNLLVNDGSGGFSATEIAADLLGGRALMAQLVAGDAAELIFDSGEAAGPTVWFQWDGSQWVRNELRSVTNQGHSLDAGDVDGDGDVDILSGEMRLEVGDAARLTVFLNDGAGSFETRDISFGMDNHASSFGDVDGDGDLDIVSKPFNWDTPRLDVWINSEATALANGWQRTVIDPNRPDRAVFLRAGDLDGDGDADLAAGPWWYQNPGDTTGEWVRNSFGEPLNQVVLLYDLDLDGDLDAFGTEGVGSEPNADMVWARNDGGGQFTVIPGIAEGDGDFVQGATAGAFGDTERLRVLISWHEAGKGIQSFSPVVGEESTRRWDYEVIIDESQDEDLSSPDVDGDGDLDVMMGTMWLPNRPGGSPTVTLHQPATGTPDRHRSVDMDGDGDIDVVVSYEDSQNGRVAWYEQGDNPEDPWTEHPIGDVTLGLSMDVGDIDRDGDIDVVVGEHSTTDPNSMSLLLFENGGDSRSWLRGRISTGDEHHDATVLVDLDGDNDLDIASLGWTHGRVVVFENPGV